LPGGRLTRPPGPTTERFVVDHRKLDGAVAAFDAPPGEESRKVMLTSPVQVRHERRPLAARATNRHDTSATT
jgi:hypothetical protein